MLGVSRSLGTSGRKLQIVPCGRNVHDPAQIRYCFRARLWSERYGGIKLQKVQKPPKLPEGPAGNSAVAIIRARSYSDDLVSRMLEGIRQCGLDVRGKRILLKPNLVEFDPATVINTNAAVIAAAVEVFHQLGAAEVKIGEGPGHRRDTLDMADDARYRATIPEVREHLYRSESRRCVAGEKLRR